MLDLAESPTSMQSTEPGNQSFPAQKPNIEPKKIFTLIDLRGLLFLSPEGVRNLDECTDEEFVAWVSRYARIEYDEGASTLWSLEDRRDVVNFLFDNGIEPEFTDPENFIQDEPAPEAVVAGAEPNK